MPLPALQHIHLVERMSGLPAGVVPRCWTFRDDNHQHYHNVVRASESPLLLQLSWCASAASPIQIVGVFLLHLQLLLKEGFVRPEPEGGSGDEIRVRFCRHDRVIYLQVRDDSPALGVGRLQ